MVTELLQSKSPRRNHPDYSSGIGKNFLETEKFWQGLNTSSMVLQPRARAARSDQELHGGLTAEQHDWAWSAESSATFALSLTSFLIITIT
jgi:hypothetical protein